MPVIFFHVSTTAKVPHPKKKYENWGEPTHRTKEKHQIEKMPNILPVNDLIEIMHKYDIPSHVVLIPISHHLCDVNDPPMGWWMVYLAPYKIGL